MRGFVVFSLLLGLVAAPAHGQSLTFAGLPDAVGAGLQTSTGEFQLSTSQHGGVTVTVAVDDSTRARVAVDASSPGRPSITVFVPNGADEAGFTVQAFEGAFGAIALQASAVGFVAALDSIDIVTPVLDLQSLTASIDVPDTPDGFRIRVGVSDTGTTLNDVQEARFGGGGITVDVEVDDPAVGRLVTSGGSGPTQTVTIAEGSGLTPSSLANGGIAFDGLAPGTTDVAATITGFLALADARRSVTVDPAEVAFLGSTITTGSGLRSTVQRARLNGSAHGGTTVTITPLDPSLVLLAEGSSAVGASGALQIFVPDGSTDAVFTVDGADGLVGNTILDIAAPGFLGSGADVEISVPFVALEGLATGQDTLDPVDAFYARVGISTNGSTVSSRAVRPGAAPLVVTAAVDDSTVAVLETLDARGAEVTAEIQPGSTTTPTSLANGGFVLDGIAAGSVDVSVSAPGVAPTTNATSTVTITQPAISFLTLPTNVGQGLVSAALRARLGASQHGGTTVRVESADPSRVLLSLAASDTGEAFVEGFVPNGSVDLVFYAHAIEDATGSVDVTATAASFSSLTSPVDVRPSAVRIEGLSGSIDTIDPVDVFYARIGALNAAGTSLSSQARRPGGPPILVTFEVSDPAIGVLGTQSDPGPSITLEIPEGASTTTTSFANGAVALDGLAAGTVDVTARIPGFTPLASADQTVTVNAAAMSFLSSSATLGAGLQVTGNRVRLSGSDHGGTTVRLASSDSTKVVLSPSSDVPGTGVREVFVPDGSIDALFVLQALDDAVGANVTIDASAVGFTGDDLPVEVVQPGLSIEGLSGNYDLGDPVDAFYVRTGIPNAQGTTVSVQARRAGGAPIEVTLESSVEAIAELVTLAGSGASQAVFVPATQSISPTSVANGGVGLRAVGRGTSVVTASAPGYFVTGAAQRTVDVDNPGIGLAGVPFFLGGGLQTVALTAVLDDASHGGVTLRIESSDPSRARIAPDVATAGTPFIELFLPNGTATASYVVQGVTGSTGSVSVDASAGSETGTVALEIVEPALEILGLADSLDVVDGDVPFVVRTGIASVDGDSLVQRQGVSASNAPLVVDVVNTALAQADLVTTASTGDSVTVSIAGGSFASAFDVASGGIAVDPRLAGPTSIRASAPGFAVTPSAEVSLVVFGDLTGVPGVRLPLALAPNRPNPFNPATTLRFSIPRGGHVQLVVFDARGRRVCTLVDEERAPGVHDVVWRGEDDDGRAVASGVYFARLRADGRRLQQKMLLVQ